MLTEGRLARARQRCLLRGSAKGSEAALVPHAAAGVCTALLMHSRAVFCARLREAQPVDNGVVSHGDAFARPGAKETRAALYSSSGVLKGTFTFLYPRDEEGSAGKEAGSAGPCAPCPLFWRLSCSACLTGCPNYHSIVVSALSTCTWSLSPTWRSRVSSGASWTCRTHCLVSKISSPLA